MKISIPNSIDTVDNEVDRQYDEHGRIKLNFFPDDDTKRIDYVLYYRENSGPFVDKKRIRKRERFIQSLVNYQANIQTIKVKVNGLLSSVDVFILLNFRTERLFEAAEQSNLILSFRKEDRFSTRNLLTHLDGDQEMDGCLLCCCPTYIHQYFVGTFNNNAKFLFDNVTKSDNTYNENFFTPKTRSLLAESILLKSQPEEELLRQNTSNPLELFDEVFILHDETGRKHQNNFINRLKDGYSVDLMLEEGVDNDAREELKSKWINCSHTQPFNDIRDYFGELVAFYFAWCGFLQNYLLVPVVIGFCLFVTHLIINLVGEYNPMTWNQKTQAVNSSNSSRVEYYYALYGATFNNFLTPYYAIFISCWGMFFVEAWKKKSLNFEYEWNVHNFKRNEIERPDAYSRRKNFWFRTFTYVIMFFSVGLVLLNIFATVTFRVYVKNALKNYEAIYQTLCGDIGSIVLSNIISILIYLVYDFMVKWQTKFEVHRTQSEYETAITLKLFVLEFANTFFPLIYIAFFRQLTWENGYFNLGAEYQDTCDASTCMTLLSLQVFISLIFSGISRFFKTFLLYALKRDLFSNWNSESDFDKKYEILQIDDESDITKFPKKILYKFKTAYANLLVEKGKPSFDDNIRAEYLEKVTLYGIVVLFSSAFMLGPIILFFLIFIDIRVDASRFLWFYKRPVGYPAQDIGIWSSILKFLNICALVTNTFIALFTCNWPIGQFASSSIQSKFIYGVLIQFFIIIFWALLSNLIPKETRKCRLKKIKASKYARIYLNQATKGELTYDKQKVLETRMIFESDDEINEAETEPQNSRNETNINFIPNNRVRPSS